MSVSPVWAAAAFGFGLMVGSFLNVCIWRLPEGEQIVRGRSHCRKCGHEIGWRDNVPLVSFALLRGKCRYCGKRISWSYPLVELITGLLFAGVAVRFGLSWLAAIYAALGAALVVVAFVDLSHMIVPDEISLPGLGVGLVLSFLAPALHGVASRWSGLGWGLAGALAGAGTLWVIGVIGTRIFRKEAMGFGDVKLMGMVGSLIGPAKVILVNFLLAPVLGAVVGLVLKLRWGRDVIPFGPFLALRTLIALFWGDVVIAWYGGLLH